jgi:c(7)-type cytochrome triheme protein
MRATAWIALVALALSPQVLADDIPDESTEVEAEVGPPAVQVSLVDHASSRVTQPEDEDEFVGEMYRIGLGWHRSELDGLPTDKFGLVNWVEALNQGLIQPRGNIDKTAPETPPFDMDISMPSKTGLISGAYFPHKTHTTWMSCDSCHIKIFLPMAGANDLTMSTIVKGEACGVCHGKVAFPLNDCARCHLPEPPADENLAAQD